MTMNFGFSIGDFIAAIDLTNKIRKEFIDAPGQFKDISDEVRSLSIVLQDLEILSERELNNEQTKELHEIASGCRNVLEKLELTPDKYRELEPGLKGVGRSIKRVWKRSKWEPDDIRDLRSRIVANVTLLNTFQGKFASETSLATRVGVDRLNERQDDRERRKEQQAILEWLTPIDYAPQQSDYINRRQEGTGRWLLESTEFQDWVITGNTLFCPGIPGSGKTLLTSIVVEELTTRFQNDKSIGVTYFYFNFRRQEEQRTQDLLTSLLKQLTQGRPFLADSVKSLHDNHRDRHTRPSADEISKTLQFVVALYSRVFIIVDALDETSFEERDKFLAAMFNLQKGREAHINVFATSRPEVTSHFTEYFEEHMSKETRATENDLITYINGRLSTIRRPRISKYPDLQDAIRREVVEAADGLYVIWFLYAKLYLDYLFSKPTSGDVEDALKDPPRGTPGLDTLYDQAIERINNLKEGASEDANKVLYWIIHAKRPLRTAELQHAIAVRDKAVELMPKYLPEIKDLISDCAGLVTIDNKTDIVRLVHYTAQEYFERTQSRWFPNAQTNITKACVTYLSFDTFGSGIFQNNVELEQRLQSNKLYNYAARNWGHHAREASTLIPEVISFLERKAQVQASSQMLGTNSRKRFPRDMTGLHLAAYFGIEVLVSLLLVTEKGDAGSKDKYGWTPLLWAAQNGHDGVVKLLLATEKVDVDSKDINYGKTPVLWAAENGYKATVNLLLEKGVDIEVKDNYGRTPLSNAAQSGHEATVSLLLEKGADIEAKDEDGRTPLSNAARRRHKATINLLLEKGADIESKSNNGRTPLLWAAQEGYEDIVKLLLETSKVDVESKDNNGRMPLSWAAEKGHKSIVQLLLVTEGIDANSNDGGDRTPLSWAAEKGHVAVIQLLLKSDKVKVDLKDLAVRKSHLHALTNMHQKLFKDL